jgi:hypothetical protein
MMQRSADIPGDPSAREPTQLKHHQRCDHTGNRRRQAANPTRQPTTTQKKGRRQPSGPLPPLNIAKLQVPGTKRRGHARSVHGRKPQQPRPHPRSFSGRTLGRLTPPSRTESQSARTLEAAPTLLVDQPLKPRTIEHARHAVTSPLTPGEPINTHGRSGTLAVGIPPIQARTARRPIACGSLSSCRLWMPLRGGGPEGPMISAAIAADQCMENQPSIPAQFRPQPVSR